MIVVFLSTLSFTMQCFMFTFRSPNCFYRWSLHLFNSSTWPPRRTNSALARPSYPFIDTNFSFSTTALLLFTCTRQNHLQTSPPWKRPLWCLFGRPIAAHPLITFSELPFCYIYDPPSRFFPHFFFVHDHYPKRQMSYKVVLIDTVLYDILRFG